MPAAPAVILLPFSCTEMPRLQGVYDTGGVNARKLLTDSVFLYRLNEMISWSKN